MNSDTLRVRSRMAPTMTIRPARPARMPGLRAKTERIDAPSARTGAGICTAVVLSVISKAKMPAMAA